MSIAVFVDVENLVGGLGRWFRPIDLRAALRQVCARLSVDESGIEHVAVYGPWMNRRLDRVRARFDVPGATFITTEVVEGGKSLLDTQLVIEAAVHDLRIGADTYLVMSGDADMVPLVRWLKARQRNVVGAGRTHSAAARLTEVCDQFALLSAKVSQQPLASAPAGLDPNARRLRDLVEELLGDRLEYPAAKLNTELRAAIAHNFGRDPDRHLQEVLGIARFKQVISALYPDGELRVSEAGSAVERSVIDEPPDEDGPAFRGALGPLSRSGGLEEPELQPWDPARVQVLDLPELVV